MSRNSSNSKLDLELDSTKFELEHASCHILRIDFKKTDFYISPDLYEVTPMYTEAGRQRRRGRSGVAV